MRLLIKIGVNMLALLVVAYIVPGFVIQDFTALLVSAVVIGIINTFLKPIIQILALPFTLVTFGLFALLVNVALLWFAAWIVPGLNIDTFLTAVVSSIILSLTSWFLGKISS
jgi:putative membrane protein